MECLIFLTQFNDFDFFKILVEPSRAELEIVEYFTSPSLSLKSRLESSSSRVSSSSILVEPNFELGSIRLDLARLHPYCGTRYSVPARPIVEYRVLGSTRGVLKFGNSYRNILRKFIYVKIIS